MIILKSGKQQEGNQPKSKMAATSSNLFLANAIMTLFFGVTGSLAPLFLVEQYGASIDAFSQMIVRCYAVMSFAYGFAMLQLRTVAQAESTLVLMSTIFNVGLVVSHVHAHVTKAGLNNMIWVGLFQHLVLSLWSLWILITNKKLAADKKTE